MIDSNIVILIPAYNCADYVEATLESLATQDEALERVDRIVLADDTSKDRTVEIARTSWSNRIPLEVFESSSNRGEYKNVNEAVDRLPERIEWMLVMHADNLAKPGWLRTLLDRIAAAGPKIGSICTSWDDLSPDGSVKLGEYRQPPTPEIIAGNAEAVRGTLLRGCWWHISSCAIRLQAFREVGGLPLGLRLKGDWDFLLRLLGAGWDVEYVPTALMLYRANPAGSSSVSFRHHRDVVETLAVIRRHDDALTNFDTAQLHFSYLRYLVRRFGGSLVVRHWERAARAVFVGISVVRSFMICLNHKRLGRRRFDWVSSADLAAESRLTLLSTKMSSFYATPETRAAYQVMVDAEESSQPQTERMLRMRVIGSGATDILEVGCGSGRIYQALRCDGFTGRYTGIEMAEHVIAENRTRFPDVTWICGSGYKIPLPTASQGFVFAYYVLEHCVFPERFLKELLRVTKTAGRVILTFPDIIETGIFGSQTLGLNESNARENLSNGRVISALVRLWDSRIRLPIALRWARRRVGPFAINLRPKCLDASVRIEPDVDAIYLASASEIENWASRSALVANVRNIQECKANAMVVLEKR
jgi:glycosyltransferase involved in cell wall biosynthesis